MAVRSIICVCIVVAGLLLAPLLWVQRVAMDWGLFTTEWYKACVEVLKLTMVFLLATVLWDAHKTKREASKNAEAWSELRSRWCVLAKKLRTEASLVMKQVEDGRKDPLAESMESLTRSSVLLESLAYRIQTEAPAAGYEALKESAYQFSVVGKGAVAQLRGSWIAGTFIPRRAIDEKDREARESIEAFAQEVEDKVEKAAAGK